MNRQQREIQGAYITSSDISSNWNSKVTDLFSQCMRPEFREAQKRCQNAW